MWQAYRRFAGGPMGLMVAGLFIVTGTLMTYRFYISPIFKRNRRDRNERYADFIYQQQQKNVTEDNFQR